MTYPTAAFDYELPRDRIAQRPLGRRDQSRLLVLDRATGRIRHKTFHDLVQLIPTGDALVLNETRVFPARLVGRKPTGAVAEILLLRPLPEESSTPRVRSAPGRRTVPAVCRPERIPGAAGPADNGASDPITRGRIASRGQNLLWEALVRPGGKLKPGRVVEVADELHVEIVDSTPDGARIVRLDTSLPVDEALARYGRTPLPPYIERVAGPEDDDRYQTVYARERGSVAAPTAGLHFTAALLEALEARGVRLVRLVLHVGVGTFRPVEVEDPGEHRMHAEQYAVSASAAASLNGVRGSGGKVWGVGTTVARALETVTDVNGIARPASGRTDLFIRAPYRFQGVDRLITNFHLPRSTLLMLAAAFGGHEAVMRAYREAVERGYRFYSYGDAMVII